MGYTQEISSMCTLNIYDGLIDDLTDYVNYGPAVVGPNGEQPPSMDAQFMDGSLVNPIRSSTTLLKTSRRRRLSITSILIPGRPPHKTCLRNLFPIRMMNNRNSPRVCSRNTFLSVMMVSRIAFKFIAVNFGAPRAPEDHDKVVIFQVPCYTEGEASLRCTVDSLARLGYDDKRKLICDDNTVAARTDLLPCTMPLPCTMSKLSRDSEQIGGSLLRVRNF